MIFVSKRKLPPRSKHIATAAVLW